MSSPSTSSAASADARVDVPASVDARRCVSPCALAVAEEAAHGPVINSVVETPLDGRFNSPEARLQRAPDATLEFDDLPGGEEAARFEEAILTMDAATVASQKRMREQDIEHRRLLRKCPGEPFPFHASVAVLNAALRQVSVLCDTEVPEYFDLSSDPKRVEKWVGSVIMASQRTQFALGQAKERAHAAPRFAPATALEIMKCCTRMNELLSTHDHCY